MSTVADVRSVGNYQLLEKIASGGMSTVYKARDVRTQTIVALKLASRAVATDEAMCRRFELEHSLTHELSHANLVRVLHCGKHEDVPYLVMEFIDGISLAQHITRNQRLGAHATLTMLLPIADALTYLHDRQIMHRDIKPGNILMGPNGQVKLADLGLIKDLESMSDLTRTHVGLGTLQYASPEQCADARAIDARSDIYALAVTLYTAMTGEYPFGKGTVLRIMQRKLADQFIVPRAKLPGLPAEVDAALRMAMNANAERRPRSVPEFVGLLTGKAKLPADAHLPGNETDHVQEAGNELDLKNRRLKVRYHVEIDGACQAALRAADQLWKCTVTDISATGFCFEGERRFEPGSTIKMRFPAHDDDAGSYLAWVRWCKSTEARTWQHGCQFVHAMDDDDMEPLLVELMDKTKLG